MKKIIYIKTAFFAGLFSTILLFNQARAQVDCTAIINYLNDYSIVIADVNQVPLASFQICSGLAPQIHLSIKNANGDTPNLTIPDIEVNWYFENTIQGTPLIITAGQNAYSFTVPNSDPSLSNNLCGIQPYIASTDRIFKALIKVPDGAGSFCQYEMLSDPFKLCCPPGNITLNLSYSTDGLTFSNNNQFCESNNYLLKVNLNDLMLPFPYAPTNDVQIVWDMYGDNGPLLNFTVNPNGDELSWPDTGSPGSVAGLTYICIQANVSNCACNDVHVEQCFYISLSPQCGSIDVLPLPPNLIPTGTPNKYNICPGLDASIGIDVGTSFNNCMPQWEYSYPNVEPGVWHQTSGTTNLTHNTNILPATSPNIPPVLWPPGETCIKYRIYCLPRVNLPGCDACQSNEITICLIDPLPVPVISTSPGLFCYGSMTTLSIDNLGDFPAGTAFEWFHNGLQISTGNTLNTSNAGNYMVTATDICGSIDSNVFQLEVCKLNAVIFYLDPECPCVGDVITLDGSPSSSTCSQPFTYSWQANSGTQISTSNDQAVFQHIPALAGTTYTLTITDTNGCTATKTLFVKPCED